MCVARCFAYYIQRSTLALCNTAYVVDVLLVDEQAHTLLALVGNNLLSRESLVADRQFGHVYLATALLYELREAVEVTSRTVVVDTYYRVYILLAQCADEVVGTLLHLRVSTLNGVQLNTVAVTAGINRRYRTATETDAIVVATYNDNLVAFLRLLLEAVALCAVANTACKHDYFVVSILLIALLMLESEQRTGDERLSELVAEVACSVRSLDKYLLRSLIKPLANGHDVLPIACQVVVIFKTRIRCHVHSCTGDRP